MSNQGQHKDTHQLKTQANAGSLDSFVLDKGIFSNIFEKDIRRVYIYKKAERLAKAIHLIAPAFVHSPALRNRVDLIAVGLVDAAILPPISARGALSRELLALSSVLGIARAGGFLSQMNTEVITREAHSLLEEIATYEEPRLFLDETPTLASLSRSATDTDTRGTREPALKVQTAGVATPLKDSKGHVLDNPAKSSRREAILSVLKSKGPSYIKDISTVIREVSEKTIQRELAALVAEGAVDREGDRRWTTYSLRS